MSLKKIYWLVSVLLISESLFSQDVHFSQFGQTPQLINPGATGVFEGSVRAHLNYRSQWSGFGDFTTYAASIDLPLAKGNGKKGYFGVGANFYKDVAGDADFGNFLGSISFSGILPIKTNHSIALGLQAGFGQYSANLGKLTWGNQFNGEEFDTDLNANEIFSSQSPSFIDLGAGIFYEFKNTTAEFLGTDLSKFNIGIAGFHLNKPKQDFYNIGEGELQRKVVSQFSGTFDIRGSKIALVPSMFYAFQGPHSELTSGMLLKYKLGASTKYTGFFKQGAIYFGTHYRLKDAIIPQVYLEFTDYMIGVSYDYNNSELSNVTGGNGGFEISVRYTARPKAIQRASFK